MESGIFSDTKMSQETLSLNSVEEAQQRSPKMEDMLNFLEEKSRNKDENSPNSNFEEATGLPLTQKKIKHAETKMSVDTSMELELSPKDDSASPTTSPSVPLDTDSPTSTPSALIVEEQKPLALTEDEVFDFENRLGAVEVQMKLGDAPHIRQACDEARKIAERIADIYASGPIPFELEVRVDAVKDRASQLKTFLEWRVTKVGKPVAKTELPVNKLKKKVTSKTKLPKVDGMMTPLPRNKTKKKRSSTAKKGYAQPSIGRGSQLVKQALSAEKIDKGQKRKKTGKKRRQPGPMQGESATLLSQLQAHKKHKSRRSGNTPPKMHHKQSFTQSPKFAVFSFQD